MKDKNGTELVAGDKVKIECDVLALDAHTSTGGTFVYLQTPLGQKGHEFKMMVDPSIIEKI